MVHTVHTCISHHTCVNIGGHMYSPSHMCTHASRHTPPAAHRYTSSHTLNCHTTRHVLYLAYMPPHTCAPHMYMLLGTHTCSVRQTHVQSDTHTPHSGLGCYSQVIRATRCLKSPCWGSHRSTQDTGSLGRPALDLPHVLPSAGLGLPRARGCLQPILFQAPW